MATSQNKTSMVENGFAAKYRDAMPEGDDSVNVTDHHEAEPLWFARVCSDDSVYNNYKATDGAGSDAHSYKRTQGVTFTVSTQNANAISTLGRRY